MKLSMITLLVIFLQQGVLINSEIGSNRICIAGSYGILYGKLLQNWHVEECNKRQKYCLSSWNSNWTTATAGCFGDIGGFDLMTLNFCESPEAVLVKKYISIECCKTDLCNTFNGKFRITDLVQETEKSQEK